MIAAREVETWHRLQTTIFSSNPGMFANQFSVPLNAMNPASENRVYIMSSAFKRKVVNGSKKSMASLKPRLVFLLAPKGVFETKKLEPKRTLCIGVSVGPNAASTATRSFKEAG